MQMKCGTLCSCCHGILSIFLRLVSAVGVFSTKILWIICQKYHSSFEPVSQQAWVVVPSWKWDMLDIESHFPRTHLHFPIYLSCQVFH